MLAFDLDRGRGILLLKPQGALTAEDFQALARSVDPYLDQKGELLGLLIEAPAFPGWENFSAMLSHFRFVRDHHRRIRRLAVVSDSRFLSVAPKFAGHFVGAEVKTFEAANRGAALAWLEGGRGPEPDPPSMSKGT